MKALPGAAVSFLHPIKGVMLPVLDLDPVLRPAARILQPQLADRSASKYHAPNDAKAATGKRGLWPSLRAGGSELQFMGEDLPWQTRPLIRCGPRPGCEKRARS